jgi:hypothetical protein
MAGHWKKIDAIELLNLPHLNSDDDCYYAKDYYSGTGYQGGEVNNDILNFKKAPNLPGQNYRTEAIYKFAIEASVLIDCESKKTYAVTAIPSSKSKSDPLYTKRFEDFFSELSKIRPCLDVIWPVSSKITITPAHIGGYRNPKNIEENYQFDGFKENAPDFILVFDDVLTSGAHFRAFKDFLIKSGYSGKVYGVFWAKSKKE